MLANAARKQSKLLINPQYVLSFMGNDPTNIFALVIGAVVGIIICSAYIDHLSYAVTTTTAAGGKCSTGWYITGYFLPKESDYTGATKATTVDGIPRTINAKFLTDSAMEGCGPDSQR